MKQRDSPATAKRNREIFEFYLTVGLFARLANRHNLDLPAIRLALGACDTIIWIAYMQLRSRLRLWRLLKKSQVYFQASHSLPP